jgi:hypothetical protein
MTFKAGLNLFCRRKVEREGSEYQKKKKEKRKK